MRLAALSLCLTALLALLGARRAVADADDGPARASAFLDRVFARLPTRIDEPYTFLAWSHADDPTEEGVGLVHPAEPIDPERLIQRVMDVDHYIGNLARLDVCQSIPDPRFHPPRSVRFRMLVNVEPVGSIQHELVQVDAGMRQGFRVVYWYDLEPETRALDPLVASRSAYSVGAWFVSRELLGYAVSNAPIREDVNLAQWTLLTTGADVMAKTIARNNLDSMLAWSRR